MLYIGLNLILGEATKIGGEMILLFCAILAKMVDNNLGTLLAYNLA